MVALILGIIAIACSALSFVGTLGGLMWVGLVLGIIAWVLGKRAVSANPADSQARTGKILGMIATIFAIVVVVIAIVLVAVAGAALMGALGM